MKRLLLFFILLVSSLLGQSVIDATSTFNAVLGPTRTALLDVVGDQVTGQGQDDFVVNGLYMKYGLVNGAQSQIVRAIFDKYESKGFGGYFRLGVDANGDGNVDLYYGVDDAGRSTGIMFQNPTGTSNTIGGTTLGSYYNKVSLTSTNYNYTSVSGDGQLTFIVVFSTVQSALSTLGITVDENTYMRYIFGTSTNLNTINQDLYGVNGLSSTATFTDSGAFSDYENFRGGRPIVPEPSTYAQVGAMLGMSVYVMYRKKKKKSS
jgi:hypothetical protein